MGYIKYTPEKKRQVVAIFKASRMKLNTFCRKTRVPARTLYRWLENDETFSTRVTLRSKIKYTKYSFEQKMTCINAVIIDHMRVVDAAKLIGVSYAMLYRWLNTYRTNFDLDYLGAPKMKGIYYKRARKLL